MSSSFFGTGDVSSWWLDKDDNNDDADNPFKAEENEKDCTIFVIDCNEKMFQAIDDQKTQTPFNNVCAAISNTLKRKIIKSKDDLVGVILYNTLETKNAMNFNNIYLLSEPDTPSANIIKQTRDLHLNYDNQFKSLKNNKQCDFRDLLWTLQNIFSEVDVQGTKYGSKRAFIFTANDDPEHKDHNATVAKAQDMLEAGMEISVFPLSNEFKIKTFYGNICTFNLDELSTESQFREHCPTLADLEDDLRVKEMKKRSIISCPLTIGANFKMAVRMYSLYRRATKESPKWLDGRTNQPLVTDTRWVCGDTGQVLDDDQIKTYHEYGPSKEKVFFTKAEMKELKTFGNPSLTLMGFKPMDRLKPYYQFKSSYFVYPDEQRCNGSTLAFHSLIIGMNDLNKFGVARFIFRKTSVPRFVALVPQIEVIDNNGNQIKPPGINMIFLPYADDIRKIDLKDGVRHRCNKPDTDILITKAKGIIDKLMIDELNQPSNPVLQKHYDALEALALEKGDNNNNNNNNNNDNDDIDDDFIDEILPPDDDMISAARTDIDDYIETLNQFGSLSSDVKLKKATSRKRKAPDNDDNVGGNKRTKARKKRKNQAANDAADYDWKNLADNDQLKSLLVKDLKKYLSSNGLKMSGKKTDLIQRIKDHLDS